MVLCLLPRTNGTFSKSGLKVNSLRYTNDGYTQKFLEGGDALVAYDTEDVSFVWVVENGEYIRFDLIEKRFLGNKLSIVNQIKSEQKQLIKSEEHANLQANIELAKQIEIIANRSIANGETSIKKIRDVRKKEERKQHKSYVKEARLNGQ